MQGQAWHVPSICHVSYPYIGEASQAGASEETASACKHKRVIVCSNTVNEGGGEGKEQVERP